MTVPRKCDESRNVLDQERRNSERRRLLASSTVYWLEHRHLGVVRDISDDGLFVFSHFFPAVGDQVEVVIDRSPEPSVAVTGTVVRTEQRFATGMTGIAIRITH